MPGCLFPRRYRRIAIAAAVMAFASLEAGPNRFQAYPGALGSQVPSGIAGARNGLLWLAAPDGVYRFDGSHYHKVPGFPFAGAQYIAVDPAQNVWAAGKQGLAEYSGGKWKTVLGESVGGMALSPVGLWINAVSGLRLISPAGEERKFPEAHPAGALVVDLAGSVWFPCVAGICTISMPEMRLESRPNPASGEWKKVVPGAGGKIWLGSLTEIASIQNGHETSRQKVTAKDDGGFLLPGNTDPFLTPQGKVWATRLRAASQAGLGLWSNSALGEDCSWFASEETRWFCGGGGVGRSRLDRDWESWWGNMFTVVSAQGFFLRKGRMPFLLTDHGIYELSPASGQWTRATESSVDVDQMIEDGHGGYWTTSREEGLRRLGADLRLHERFPHLCASGNAIRALLRDGKGRTWIGGKDPSCFFEVTGDPGHWKFEAQKIPGAYNNTVAIHEDHAGRIWVGYQDGLAYRDDSGVWRTARTSEPVTLVREFAFDGEAAIWVSRRRGNFFVKLERRGDSWNVRKFPAAQYPPEDTYDLHRDSRGWIWRGTASGLLVARPGHTEPADWLRINKASGLGSKNVNLGGWAEDESGSIWVAGTDGVTRFKPAADWFDVPRLAKPMVTRLSAGERTWLDPEAMPARLPVGAHTIEVDLSSIDAAAFRESRLRYRLLPYGEAWLQSSDGTLKFANLGDGDYTLEAAYTGAGQPEVMRWSFHAGNSLMTLLMRGGSLVLIGVAGLAAWTRREWLHYWLAKPLFLAKTLLSEEKENAISWNTHVGNSLSKRFEIIEPISRGGFSVTYRARDLRTGDEAAVKVLHRAPGQESFVRHRFAHEVAALHTLHHPGVVRLIDSWISRGGEPCLAMEFLQGPTLRQIESDGPIPHARAAGLIEQIGSALAAIHERGIVHRDLKPENMIVLDEAKGERVLIIDFGTSAARGPEQDLESTMTLTGSLHYLAPERLTRRYSTASDVYSLGVIILEMLTGLRPAEFEIAPMDPAFVGVAGAMIGEPVAALLVEALEHQPSKRPVDAEAWTRKVAELLRKSA